MKNTAKMTQRERAAMLKKCGKEHGYYLEVYGEDGKPFMTSEAPVEEPQAIRIVRLWRTILRENKKK